MHCWTSQLVCADSWLWWLWTNQAEQQVSGLLRHLTGTQKPKGALCCTCYPNLCFAHCSQQEQRSEKSMPVGVGHGRPWIDQWRPEEEQTLAHHCTLWARLLHHLAGQQQLVTSTQYWTFQPASCMAKSLNPTTPIHHCDRHSSMLFLSMTRSRSKQAGTPCSRPLKHVLCKSWLACSCRGHGDLYIYKSSHPAISQSQLPTAAVGNSKAEYTCCTT